MPGYPSLVEPWFYKRMEYESEREVRVLIQRLHEPPHLKELLDESARHLAVNLTELIEKIIVSPFADSTFKAKVHEAMSSHGLSVDLVVESRMRAMPLVP